MTRRQRKEYRLQQRLEWAESRDHKAETALGAAKQIADQIPLGQPILVGHHSEKHARKDAERIDNNMRKGLDSHNMAQHHRDRAAGIERQLETSIFSDDPDAIERLEEKLAKLTAKRDRMKVINAEIRKGGEWDKRLTFTQEEKRDLELAARFNGVAGYPGYALTNIGATIRATNKRLESLRNQAAKEENKP